MRAAKPELERKRVVEIKVPMVDNNNSSNRRKEVVLEVALVPSKISLVIRQRNLRSNSSSIEILKKCLARITIVGRIMQIT